MDGSLHSPPCVLDTGHLYRYDGCVNSIEATVLLPPSVGMDWLDVLNEFGVEDGFTSHLIRRTHAAKINNYLVSICIWEDRFNNVN